MALGEPSAGTNNGQPCLSLSVPPTSTPCLAQALTWGLRLCCWSHGPALASAAQQGLTAPAVSSLLPLGVPRHLHSTSKVASFLGPHLFLPPHGSKCSWRARLAHPLGGAPPTPTPRAPCSPGPGTADGPGQWRMKDYGWAGCCGPVPVGSGSRGPWETGHDSQP